MDASESQAVAWKSSTFCNIGFQSAIPNPSSGIGCPYDIDNSIPTKCHLTYTLPRQRKLLLKASLRYMPYDPRAGTVSCLEDFSCPTAAQRGSIVRGIQ